MPPLFDQDKLAAELTEIVKDPYTAQQLPIQKLETGEDGRTFTFQITSSQDAKKDSTDKDKKTKKEVFYFSYDYPTRKFIPEAVTSLKPMRVHRSGKQHSR